MSPANDEKALLEAESAMDRANSEYQEALSHLQDLLQGHLITLAVDTMQESTKFKKLVVGRGDAHFLSGGLLERVWVYESGNGPLIEFWERWHSYLDLESEYAVYPDGKVVTPPRHRPPRH